MKLHHVALAATLITLTNCQTRQTASSTGQYIPTPQQIQAQNHADATAALFSRPISTSFRP